ncbi:MAG TPA: hypothetical protein IAB69_00125 [Candidatus Coproplasma excrementigallinarum]|uniref:Uncharacterized protein n=1 Tax=Candidatus Coproplasma excrementigallinarum TaxID=2840747 RepID=A0A9D1MIT7_9FIRM|nr:hypothetical protein [Candidatus Coproplasma excrementigallinarum]
MDGKSDKIKAENGQSIKAGRAVNITVNVIFAAALFVFLISFAISLPIVNRWFY